MVCPRCGVADNPADALYCENCSEQLIADGRAAAPSVAVSDLPPAPPQASPAGPAFTAPVAAAVPESTPAELIPVHRASESALALPVASAAGQTQAEPSQPQPEFDPEATIKLPQLGWQCAACGAENVEGDGFCADCGAERAQGPAPLQSGETFAGWQVIGPSAGGYAVKADADNNALLRFGEPDALAENAMVLALLGDPAVAQAGLLVPGVVASGVDPERGAYALLSQPPGAWQALSEASALTSDRAAALLKSLLVAAQAAATAGRALLVSPLSTLVELSDAPRLLLDNPAAPLLPLTGPLLADPAFLPPELLPNATNAAEPFRVAAFAAGQMLHAVTGSALGFPPRWHATLRALRAADPAERPADAMAALALLDAPATADMVGAHRAACMTDIGHHHPVNQDAGGVWTWQREGGPDVTLAVVCDGVSAGEHSEDASRLAVDLLHLALEAHWADADLTPDRAEELLRLAGLEAQRRICQMPASSYERANASTLVAACVIGGDVAGIWCGDSRAYGITADGLVQLTKDHSWVNLMVDSGRMSLEQARNDPRAHVIARWLGASDSPHTDPGFEAFRLRLAPGDRLLLCSDGLYMYFDPPADDPQKMGVIALAHGERIADAVDELVGLALDRGGFDNITAVLVEMLPAAPAT